VPIAAEPATGNGATAPEETLTADRAGVAAAEE
jgi:hypothetical protein